MEVKLTREEVELAILIHIFSKTGMRLSRETARVIIDTDNDYYAASIKEGV